MTAFITVAAGTKAGLNIHDIFYNGDYAYDQLIDASGAGGGGEITRIVMRGVGTRPNEGIRVDGAYRVHDNRIFADDECIVVEDGDVYIYDNDLNGDGSTTGIQVITDFSAALVGPNVYRDCDVPFVDADTDVTTTVFTDTKTLRWHAAGAIATGDGTERIYFPERSFVLSVSIAADTAGTGTGLIEVDVDMNGTTLFTDQNERPTLAATEEYSGEQGPEISAIPAGNYLTYNVDAITATTPGDDLTVMVRYVELPAR